MRRILILWLWLIVSPVCAASVENLMENLRFYNATITDGVVTQITADSMTDMKWKLQIFYNNNKHQPFGDMSYDEIVMFVDNRLGFISFTVTMPDDLEDLAYFRFGLNGKEIDTLVVFDIKNVVPNTTYTLQWRVLNNTQGLVSWDDMRLVHCGAGYTLELGDTNCSRPCENQTVVGGHIPADIARVYEPGICTYTPSNLVCDDGYKKIDAACERLCAVEISSLHFGNNSIPLYDRKIGTPVLCVQYNGKICYGRLALGKNTGLNVELNGAVYHLID